MSVDLKKQDFFPKSIKLYFLNKKNNGSSISEIKLKLSKIFLTKSVFLNYQLKKSQKYP